MGTCKECYGYLDVGQCLCKENSLERDKAALVEENSALKTSLADAERVLKLFRVYGTDACRNCEGGRTTLYVLGSSDCVSCRNAKKPSDEPPSLT